MRWLALCFILAAGAVFAAPPLLERLLLYPFDPRHSAPAEAGLQNVTEITLKAGDQDLVVWYHPPRPDHPVILYFHGNAGNLATRSGRFQRLLDQGYGLYAPGYRGSSGSTGWPQQQALTQDALRAYQDLLGRTAGSKIVIYGESLGTAVTAQMVPQLANTGLQMPSALIFEAPFTSIPEMAARIYPQLHTLAENSGETWSSLAQMPFVKTPLLVLHGTRDELTPFAMGQRIYDAAPSKHKAFVTAQNAGHLDLWRTDTVPQLWAFIETYAAARR